MTFFWIGKGLIQNKTEQNKTKIPRFQEPKTKETGARVKISPSKSWRVPWSEWECFLSGVLGKHNGRGCVCGGQCFRLSPVGAWWNTSCRVIEVWSRAAREVTRPTPCAGRLSPHSLSLLFVQGLYAPQVMGLPLPPGEASPPWMEPSLKKDLTLSPASL